MSILKKIFYSIGKTLSKRNLYLIHSLKYNPHAPTKLPVNLDYVRYRTLELCCNEINKRKVQGNLAELGVYTGNFASKMNLFFSDRKLYLFDTFEGFDSKDLKIDSAEFGTPDQDFSDTSIDLVLSKMQYPEQCIVKKGYFPDTATDVEDQFCLVSLDADLYEPILNGLKFFYPKLVKNGYIFIHDFNNEGYKGCRQAVLEFCEENNINFVPIPDGCGSVIITK